MASFNIIRTDDPSPYRDQITRLWEENLPGTPSGRFDWMQSGNPAGPAVWFLAFEQGGGEVAGTMAIMPKRMYYRGAEIKAGILGDYMVSSKHRVFGPNLLLLREPLRSLDELGLSFIYTIPNDSSRKVAERAGIKCLTKLGCHVRPLDYKKYLGKILPASLAAVITPAVGLAFRVSSMETWLSFKGAVEETSGVGDEFDLFWEHLRDGSNDILGDRSAAYLRWRYGSHPHFEFRFLVCRRKDETGISGYAVFCRREEDKLDIYDLQALDGACYDALVRALIGIGRTEKSQAMYFVAPVWSANLQRLRRFRFIDTKESLHLGFYGGEDLPLAEWDLVSGDRNI